MFHLHMRKQKDILVANLTSSDVRNTLIHIMLHVKFVLIFDVVISVYYSMWHD